MSSDEIDAFRAELLRQKIIFEAELRRQRDRFEEQLMRMAQELADREADCRNLQAVVTILGKKVDSVLERRMATPQRRPSPGPPASRSVGDDSHRELPSARPLPSSRGMSPSTRQSSPFRRNTNSSAPILGNVASASGMYAPSVSTIGSRQNSPVRTVTSLNGQRPKIKNEDISSKLHHQRHHTATTSSTSAASSRRTSGVYPQKIKVAGDW